MDNSAGRSWLAPLGVGLVVVVIIVVVALVATRDDPAVSADPVEVTTTTATGESSTPAEPTSEATSTTDPGIDYTKAALKAADDGFPAMVPAEVPPGWSVTEAAYTPGKGGNGPAWRMSLRNPGGVEVVLNQTELALDQAVRRYLGADAVAAGKVDLRDYGTGYWHAYTVGKGFGIAKALPSTAVVVAAPDKDSAVTLAQTLLTVEDANLPEAG